MWGLGTAAWVYARDYFQHPLETLLLLSAVYLLFAHRGHLRPGHTIEAGLALGLGILTRVNLVLIVPAIAVYLLYLSWQGDWTTDLAIDEEKPSGWEHLKRASKPALLNLLGLLLPVAGALALLTIINQIRYGSIPIGQGGSVWLPFSRLMADSSWRLSRVGWSNPLWLGLYANLFSPGRSLFLYSPPAVLTLFALGRFYRRQPAEAVLFVAIFLLYLLPYSVYGHWHGGWAWGPRLLLPILPFLLLPAGYFVDSHRHRVVAALLTVLGMGVQVLGVTVNYSYVHWDWLRLGLSLEKPDYLFLPQISPCAEPIVSFPRWSIARVVLPRPGSRCPTRPAFMKSGLRIRARPTRRFRERSPVAVRMRSPTPASPENVSGSPPRRVPRRRISASARVRRAALVLWPSFSPSTMPAAIATTFFVAPEISTPTTSLDR